MKQLTLLAPGRTEWLDVPAPRIESTLQCLVRPTAVAVCDFDRALVAGRYTALPYPIALGHEIAGVVLETGKDVKTVKAGDRVVVPLQVSCGTCGWCARGLTNSCGARRPLSNYGLGAAGGNWGGGMSDVLRIPFADAMLLKVPEGCTAADCAAVGCNLVDAFRTVAPSRVGSRASVLVVGGYAVNMALYVAQLARRFDYAAVVYADADAASRARAQALGVRAAALDSIAEERFDLIVDCSGDEPTFMAAMNPVAKDGLAISVWPYAAPLTIPYRTMFARNAQLVTGQPHARANMGDVLADVARGKLGTHSIPTETLPWASAQDRYGRGELKQVFVRD
jgi:alcohol dehydrogenase